MTRVFFVRHAQPEHAWEDDRTRPLAKDGNAFAEYVGVMPQLSMKNRITFSRKDLGLPFITYNEAMWTGKNLSDYK